MTGGSARWLRRGTQGTELPSTVLPIPTSWLEADPAALADRDVPAGCLVLLRTRARRPVCLVITTADTPGSALVDLCRPAAGEADPPGVTVLDRATSELPATHVSPGTRPSVAVVVPTIGSTADLERMLPTLAAQSDWVDQVIVVPNGCDPGPVRDVVSRLLGPAFGSAVDVIPSGAGVSRARNVGLASAHQELCAFLDDDVSIDPGWGRAAAAAAVRHPDAALFSGLVLGTAPSTEPQFWFESVGGFRKGFDEVRHDGRELHGADALLRVARLSTGANVLGRTEVLMSLGGYCEALGPGTPAIGAEDLNLALDVLDSGGSVVYVPEMVVQHPAQGDWARLEDQAVRYGQGLTSLATHRVLSGRVSVPQLVALVPRALSVVSDRTGYAGDSSVAFPARLKRLEARGLVAGPLAYLRTPRPTRRPVFVGGRPGRPSDPA
jgi:GT2 family glycosyltransferase